MHALAPSAAARVCRGWLICCMWPLALLLLVLAAHVVSATASPLPSKATGTPLVEILYVTGCEHDSDPLRDTTGCFAHSSGGTTDTVQLSLRGLHFPTESATARGGAAADHAVPQLRLCLSLHQPPALELPAAHTEGQGQQQQEQQQRVAASREDEAHACPWQCTQLRASSLFPSELLRCTLSHPLKAAQGLHDATLLARLRRGPTWLDVSLQRVLAAASGQTMHADPHETQATAYETIARLRRAVRVDVSAAAGMDAQAMPALHPLEQFYMLPHKSRPRAGNDTQTSSPDGGEEAEKEAHDVWAEMGVGGLKEELHTLFRRVFLDRLPSLAALTTALEVQHVRGVILHGPPGNGKTLIARTLARLLGEDTRLTTISAPDILSKYVGESEKNLRDALLEGDAEDDEDDEEGGEVEEEDDRGAKGGSGRRAKFTASHRSRGKRGLHVLIIDELDALFHRRGFSSDESAAKAVYDGVTNTLLALMDGLYTRNDFLIIGLTNRLHAIDSALLRPGRFEVIIEIPYPELAAREEIFFLHAANLRHKGMIAANVSYRVLATRSEGFSGADIAGTVRSAVSYALLRYRESTLLLQQQQQQQSSADDNTTTSSTVDGGDYAGFQITMADFARAMRDIRNAKSEATMLTHLAADDEPQDEHGGPSRALVDVSGNLRVGMGAAESAVRRVMRSRHTFSAVVAVVGAAGVGKTSVARELARRMYAFVTVRFVACRQLIKLASLEEQLELVRDALSDASRSASGLVVLDDVDVLLRQVSRDGYAEAMLQSLLEDYVHRPQGVSRGQGQLLNEAGVDVFRASRDGDARAATSSRRRVLLLTASDLSGMPRVQYDSLLRLHPLHGGGVEQLLVRYRVVPRDARNLPRDAARHYPTSLSYRDFLRITDMALLRVQEEGVKGKNASTGEAAAAAAQSSSSSGVDERFVYRFPVFAAQNAETQPGRGGDGEAAVTYRLTDESQVRAFMRAVSQVVAEMGLRDPFMAWYLRDPTSPKPRTKEGGGGGGSNDDDEEDEDGEEDGEAEAEGEVDEDEVALDQAAFRSAGEAAELLW